MITRFSKRVARATLHVMAGIASRIVRRSDQVWVVGGNNGLRFADNSMYFFKYCHENCDIKVVWLTRSNDVNERVRSEGYCSYMTHSLLGIFYGLRASWHIYDVTINDTSCFTSANAKQLNMWHGYPIKDIRCLKPRKPIDSLKRSCWRWVCNTHREKDRYYMVHQNKKYLWQITDSFDVKPAHVIIANYPRNIVFQEGEDSTKYTSTNASPWIMRLSQTRDQGNRVLGYFPTWRGDGTDSFLGTRSVNEIVELNQFLAEQNLIIATKWHTCVFKAYQHNGACKEAESLSEALAKQSNIIVLGFDQDLNSLLEYCDLLISDYSGVIIDFLLAGRPQIFLAYDLEAYEKKWGFLFRYEDFVPGPICHTLKDLVSELQCYSSDQDSYSDHYRTKRDALRRELFDTLDGSSLIISKMESIEL